MPILENSLSISYKVQHIVPMPAIPFLGIYYLLRRSKNRYLHENLYVKVSSGSIHTCAKLEQPKCHSARMAKQTVVDMMAY